MNFKKVKLYSGSVAASDFVVDVYIPDYRVHPDVILWGSRYFKYVNLTTYLEIFTHFVPPGYDSIDPSAVPVNQR